MRAGKRSVLRLGGKLDLAGLAGFFLGRDLGAFFPGLGKPDRDCLFLAVDRLSGFAALQRALLLFVHRFLHSEPDLAEYFRAIISTSREMNGSSFRDYCFKGSAETRASAVSVCSR